MTSKEDKQDITIPAEMPTQQPEDGSKGKKNRKSRNVRKTSAEKYRFHVNDLWQKQRDIEQAQKYGYTLPFMNIEPQKLDPPIMKVPQEVSFIDKIIEASHEYATQTMKVVGKPDDIAVLKTAASCQLVAKTYYSHKNNELDTSVGYDKLMNYIATHFESAIEPIAYFVDNIGTTQFEEQIIVPTLPEDSVAIYPPPETGGRFNMSQVARCEQGDLSFETDDIDSDGMQLQIVARHSNLHALRQAGVITAEGVEPGLTPDFLARGQRSALLEYQRVGMSLDTLAQKYQDVMNRYSRRLRGKIRGLAIKQAAGKLTQLVGSELKSDELGRVDAWAIRKVDDATLVTGAMLRLGTNTYQAQTAKFAIKRGIVSRSQAIGKIVSLLG